MTELQYDEWSAVAERFGVDLEQVRRDHLISHVLGAIAEGVPTDDVVFFGGTALSRTYLTDARLSEDIDLIALAPRADVAARIALAVRRGLARSHGRPTWRPTLSATAGSQPATLAVAGAPLAISGCGNWKVALRARISSPSSTRVDQSSWHSLRSCPS